MLFALPTNEFGGLVGPLVDEGFEGLLHGVDERLITCKAALHNIVHLVLEVQKILNHVLVLLWRANDLPPERLEPEGLFKVL